MIKNNNNGEISLVQLNKAYEFIDELIAKAFTYAGQEIKSDDLVFLSHELVKIIKTRYRNITQNELIVVFEKGLFGDYGEYFGLNIRSFEQWIKSYYYSEDRIKHIQNKYNSNQLQASCEITESEKNKALKYAFNKRVNEYKQGLYINDFGNVVYDFLDKNGKVKLSKEFKKELFEKAKRIKLSDYKKELYKTKDDLRIPIANIIKDIESNQSNTNDKIVCEAKRLALFHVFKELEKSNDLDFDKIIK